MKLIYWFGNSLAFFIFHRALMDMKSGWEALFYGVCIGALSIELMRLYDKQANKIPRDRKTRIFHFWGKHE